MMNYLATQLNNIEPHNSGPFTNPTDEALHFIGSEALAQQITDDKPIQGVNISDWYKVICSMKRTLAKNISLNQLE